MHCYVYGYFNAGDVNHVDPLVIRLEAGEVNTFYYPCIPSRAWAKTRLINLENLEDSLDVFNCSMCQLHTLDLSVRSGTSCRGCRTTQRIVARNCDTDGSYYRSTYETSDKSLYYLNRLKDSSSYQTGISGTKDVLWSSTFFHPKKPNTPLLFCTTDKSGGHKWYKRTASNSNKWVDVKVDISLNADTLPTASKDELIKLLVESYIPLITFDLSKSPTGDYCSYTDSLSGRTIEVEKRLEGKYVKLVHTVVGEDSFKVGNTVHRGQSYSGIHSDREFFVLSVFYWSLDYECKMPLFVEAVKYDRCDYYNNNGTKWEQIESPTKLSGSALAYHLNKQNCYRNNSHRFQIYSNTTGAVHCFTCGERPAKVTWNRPQCGPSFAKIYDCCCVTDLVDRIYDEQTGIPCFRGVKEILAYFDLKTNTIPLLICVVTMVDDRKGNEHTTVTWCRRDSEDSNNWSLGLGLPYIPDAYPDVMTEILENFPKTTVAVDTGKNFYSDLKIDNLGYYYETSLTGKERVTIHVTITEDFLPDLGDYCRITHRPQNAAITALKNGEMVLTGFSDLCNYSSASIYYWTVDDTRTTPLLIQLGDYYYTTKNGTDWTRDPTVLLTNLSETLDRHNCLRNDTHHVDLARTTVPTKDTLYKCLSCGITNITLKCVKSPNVPECTYYEQRVDGKSVAKYFIGSTHQDGLPPTDTVNTLHVYLNVNGVANGPVLVHIPIDDKTDESLSAGWFERVPNTGDSWFQEPTLYDREDPVSESVRRAVIKASVKTLDIDIGKETGTTLGEVKVALDKYTGPYRPITFSPKDAKIGRVKFRDQVQLGFPLLSTYPSLTAYYWTLDVDLNNPLIVGLGDGNEYYSRRDGNTWHNDGLLSTPTLLTERLDLYNCLKNGSHIIDISPIDAKILTEKSDYPCPSCAHKVSVTMTHISKYTLSTHTVNDYSISKFRDGGIDQTGLPSLKNLKNAYVYHYSQVGGKALLIWLPSLTTVDKNAKPRKLLEDIYRRTTIFSNDWIQLSPTLIGDVNSTLEFEESKILELLQAVDNDSLKTDKLA